MPEILEQLHDTIATQSSEAQFEQRMPAVLQDRRAIPHGGRRDQHERRQFVDSRQTFRPEVLEFAEAIDQYKLRHRRRFITFEELFDVMCELGYRKD